MDGVLWRGSQALPGMTDFFDFLFQREISFVLATNNSRNTPADYVDKLASMGVTGIKPCHIVTSGTATAITLQAAVPGRHADLCCRRARAQAAAERRR